MERTRVVIMGAAGRDFHNFNVYFRARPEDEVVAFTATQIPNIAGRRYPAELSGPHYPTGIPIFPESELTRLIRQHTVQQVVFAYSDVSHLDVMHRASTAMAAGADFRLLGPGQTMIKSKRPVVAVTAVRTGVGKSQTTRRVTSILKAGGLRVAVVRHPMPYGDLREQIVQRFAVLADLDRHHCTIEEREEYAPHLSEGNVVFAGIDYARILEQAEAEADVVVWDGGNNDYPFYAPDYHLVLLDPLRPGHETRYFPGEVNLKMAHCAIINKIDSARPETVAELHRVVAENNPQAVIIDARSPIKVTDADAIQGARVLAIEDGPTITHGEMSHGAAYIASQQHGAAEIVDPRPYAVGTLKAAFETYPHLGKVLPAMGYSQEQMDELKATIEATPADLVVIGTPIDLASLLHLKKPSVHLEYSLEEVGKPDLADLLAPLMRSAAVSRPS
ncbi:MAG TPA: cyclic 2,3-diphosphoglycerate synthase [Candidatus Xenobia bacterium]|jgi:predicted GTPase